MACYMLKLNKKVKLQDQFHNYDFELSFEEYNNKDETKYKTKKYILSETSSHVDISKQIAEGTTGMNIRTERIDIRQRIIR